jgi:hypothetical protein
MVDTPLGRERRGYLGLRASSDPRDLSTNYPGILAALQIGAARSWDIARQTGVYVAHLVKGNETPAKLSVPIQIAQISNLVAARGIPALLNFAALLSVSLGMINLVPVPMLDGGHLLFYAIERVRGKPLGRRAQEVQLPNRDRLRDRLDERHLAYPFALMGRDAIRIGTIYCGGGAVSGARTMNLELESSR